MTAARPARLLLCEGLSGALGRPLRPADLPSGEAEWRGVMSLASAHLVPCLLRWAFAAQGLAAEPPPNVVEFLDAVYALNLESNLLYEDQLAHLIRALNAIGVRPVLLKGAAALVSGLYPTQGERMIGDVDMLIPAARLAEAVAALHRAGYRPLNPDKGDYVTENYDRKGHHYPALNSLDWPAKVELHVHPVHLMAARLLGAAELVRDAAPFTWRGGECLIPSRTHFAMQNIIHAFIVDTNLRGIVSFRQLFEFVLAGRTYGEAIDWAAMARRFDDVRQSSLLHGYCGLANACLGFDPPLIVAGGLARWRRRFYRVQLERPALHFTVSLGRVLRRRAGDLISSPRRLKTLARVDKYARLYKL